MEFVFFWNLELGTWNFSSPVFYFPHGICSSANA
jgi:hypothetical protein